MSQTTDEFEPGQRVVVTQQIPQRDEVWTIELTGEVVRFEQRKTGSWFAHSKDDKLWLDRLVVRKDDGEIVTLNLDRYTQVEVVAPAQGAAPQKPRHSGPEAADDPAESMRSHAAPSGQTGAHG